MTIQPNEIANIEKVIKQALSDVSRPNPMHLRAGLRILMTTNQQTFDSIGSESIRKELKDFQNFLQNPKILAPESTKTPEGALEVIEYIKHFTLQNLNLLDIRTSILPNTEMVQKSIMEGERLKSVVHTSALKNVVTNAHYFDGLEKKFRDEGMPEEKIPHAIELAVRNTAELHTSVLEGNISHILKNLSVHGVDVNYPDERGYTPLCIAAREGYTETVKLLLTVQGINVNAVTNNGWTPLHIAARMGFSDVVDALLTRPDIKVNLVNSDGWTPLHWAAWHGHIEVVTVLLTAPGILVNATDRNGTAPLHLAARNGHPDVIRVFLTVPGVLVNITENDLHTPLNFAAQYNHEGAVSVLISSEHIDPNLADLDGLTPLHWAARNNEVGILKKLLSNRDTLTDILDHNGMTPLDWAIRHGHTECIKILNPHPEKNRPRLTWWQILMNKISV